MMTPRIKCRRGRLSRSGSMPGPKKDSSRPTRTARVMCGAILVPTVPYLYTSGGSSMQEKQHLREVHAPKTWEA
jgi:hypothetical protein